MNLNDIKRKITKKKIDPLCPPHIHCIICSEPKDFDDLTDFHGYVCNTCMHTFPDDYIMYRMKCWDEGIYREAFNLLEERLALGDRNRKTPIQFNENEEVLW